MKDNILVRALGEFEVYQFMDSIDEFTEFYKANQENFSIFEIADLSEIEKTEVSPSFTVYDMTLKHSGQHFWLIKDEASGMYEPVEDEEQINTIVKHLEESETEEKKEV